MLQKMTRTNEKGFTLIELMIVIAIIGILAAIAIPNFIAYRNKAFCSATESDANSVAAAIANYFAIPTHTNLTGFTAPKLSGTNSLPSAPALNTTNNTITIKVTDGSGRCPTDYQTAMAASGTGSGWASGVYTKVMNP